MRPSLWRKPHGRHEGLGFENVSHLDTVLRISAAAGPKPAHIARRLHAWRASDAQETIEVKYSGTKKQRALVTAV